MLKGRVARTAQTQQRQDGKYRDECCARVSSFPRVLRWAKSALGPIQAPPNPHSQEHRGDDKQAFDFLACRAPDRGTAVGRDRYRAWGQAGLLTVGCRRDQ